MINSKLTKRPLGRNLGMGSFNNAVHLSGISASVVQNAMSQTQVYVGHLDNLKILNENFLGRIAEKAGNLTALRNMGVEGAWGQEKILAEMGGGTREWSNAQLSELIQSGRVRDIQGHHINDVSNNPDLASNRANIEFLTRPEHRDAHGGNWRTPTEGDLQDRNTLIEIKAQQKVIINEIAAGLIAFGIGFLIGGVASYIKNRQAKPIQHLKAGAQTGGLMVLSYATGRAATYLIGGSPLVASLQSRLAEKFGEEIAKEVVGKVVAGVGIALVLSFVTYVRLRRAGHSSYYATRQAVGIFVISLVSIMVTSIVGGMVETALVGAGFGSVAGPVGTIVGIIAGILFSIIMMFVRKVLGDRQSQQLLLTGMDGRYLIAARSIR